ncbi:Transcriptional regulator [Paraburkholderia caribensis MBA4]|uniref:Transcriptional regulator n=1 Tax=Paraburkholderia caribensis MBA4 TaxID=1323664 RepID=A0A0P0RHQ3_9BURK|nr:GntR family transcriptional regulator [Paraburkholderia caribensis]ALL68290.1 Transcriptional regulator [Paraburkholderia caribensis MBA4]
MSTQHQKSDKPPLQHSLADEVANKIDTLIAQGTLSPGQLLPSERRLTEKLGTSRTVVREAIRTLRARGIIETTPGRGSYVRKLKDDVSHAPFMNFVAEHPKLLYDLLDLRSLIEPQAARQAAENGTTGDFNMITYRYRQLAGEFGKDLWLNPKFEYAFHFSVWQASHNTVLVHTLQSLSDPQFGHEYHVLQRLPQSGHHRELAQQYCASLYDAVMTRRPQDAANTVIQYFINILETLRVLSDGDTASSESDRTMQCGRAFPNASAQIR